MVAPAEHSTISLMFSPSTAAVARASRPEGPSSSSFGISCSETFLFLEPGNNKQYVNHQNCKKQSKIAFFYIDFSY